MDHDRSSYGIDASDSGRLVLVLRQGGKIVSRRCLDPNPGAVAALTDLIRKGQGKPVVCINSTGEVALSLAFTITNDVPCAEVMLVFPHALRHAATTTNQLGNHRGPDSNADLLARHAERLLRLAAEVAGLLTTRTEFSKEESAMDLIYVSIVVIFFAATAALVYGCERLGRSA